MRPSFQQLLSTDRNRDPEGLVAAIDAAATRFETPCGDGVMVWRRWGRGAPVVLIHGNVGTWRHWICNIGPLAESRTVWVPDLPGFGDSTAPEDISIEAIADAVVHGAETLMPQQIIDVAGFSFGACIATMFGIRLKDRLRSLTLTGARFASYLLPSGPPYVSWRKLEGRQERLAAHRHNLETAMIADPARIDDFTVYLQAESTEHARASARKWRSDASERLEQSLPRVRASAGILVVFGERDDGAKRIVEDLDAARAALRPDALFRVIPDVGHWVQYEGHEQVNALLLETLSA